MCLTLFFSPLAQVDPLPQGQVLLEVQADQEGPRPHGRTMWLSQMVNSLNPEVEKTENPPASRAGGKRNERVNTCFHSLRLRMLVQVGWNKFDIRWCIGRDLVLLVRYGTLTVVWMHGQEDMSVSKSVPHRGAGIAVTFRAEWTCRTWTSTVTLQSTDPYKSVIPTCKRTDVQR